MNNHIIVKIYYNDDSTLSSAKSVVAAMQADNPHIRVYCFEMLSDYNEVKIETLV